MKSSSTLPIMCLTLLTYACTVNVINDRGLGSTGGADSDGNVGSVGPINLGGALATGGTRFSGGTSSANGGTQSSGGVSAATSDMSSGGTSAASGGTSNGSTFATTGGASTGGTQTLGTSGAAAGTSSTGGSLSSGGTASAGGESATGGSIGLGGNPSLSGGASSTNPSQGGTSTGGLAATGGTQCTPGTQIGSTASTNYFVMAYPQLTPFYVFNNGWTAMSSTLNTAGMQQSISAYETCIPGTISWQTDYDWSGVTNSVKAFPAAILGWESNKGWQVASQNLLPRTISSLLSTQCSWTYSVTGGALQAISFYILVHNNTCNQSSIDASSLPSDEVTIWLNASDGIQPIGSRVQTDLIIDNAGWALWEGADGSLKAHSFVRQGNVTSVDHLDIKAFLRELNLDSKCLTSIQAGTEVFQGNGTVHTSSYSCEVQ